LALAAALAGCDTKRRATVGAVTAEIHAPIHAVVRVHTYDVKPECTESGLLRLRCFFQSELRGCTWLEVGPPPDIAGLSTGVFDGTLDEHLCGALADGDTTAVLETVPLPSRGMELVADPSGTRIAWRAAPDKPWHIFYLLGGVFLRNSKAVESSAAVIGPRAPDDRPGPAPALTFSGPLDWSKVPSLSERAVDFVASAHADRLDQLLATIEKDRGQIKLGRVLAAIIDSSEDAAWRAAWERLGPPGRAAFWEAVHLELEDAPSTILLSRLCTTRELQPPGFADTLVKNLERRLAEGRAHFESTAPALEALLHLGDARAGTLACEWLGAFFSRRLGATSDGPQEWGVLRMAVPALVAVARFRTACPWVGLALEWNPCDADYRCTPSGLVETSDRAMKERALAEEAARDRQEAASSELQNPLCTPQQLADTVTRWTPWWLAAKTLDGEDVPRTDTEPPFGALLLAAAYAQGPLPAAFLKRNSRRFYQVVDRSPSPRENQKMVTPTCGLGEQGFVDPQELACQVPPTLARLPVAGCRIEIDDARKVIRLTPPKALAPVHPPRME
jgi:hypothetical protein